MIQCTFLLSFSFFFLDIQKYGWLFSIFPSGEVWNLWLGIEGPLHSYSTNPSSLPFCFSPKSHSWIPLCFLIEKNWQATINKGSRHSADIHTSLLGNVSTCALLIFQLAVRLCFSKFYSSSKTQFKFVLHHNTLPDYLHCGDFCLSLTTILFISFWCFLQHLTLNSSYFIESFVFHLIMSCEGRDDSWSTPHAPAKGLTKGRSSIHISEWMNCGIL